jgi:hypothetical protein
VSTTRAVQVHECRSKDWIMTIGPSTSRPRYADTSSLQGIVSVRRQPCEWIGCFSPLRGFRRPTQRALSPVIPTYVRYRGRLQPLGPTSPRTIDSSGRDRAPELQNPVIGEKNQGSKSNSFLLINLRFVVRWLSEGTHNGAAGQKAASLVRGISCRGR